MYIHIEYKKLIELSYFGPVPSYPDILPKKS